MHKDLWPMDQWQEWFGVFFTVIWITACFLAGMSGGGTLVPLMRIIFKFSASDAIIISNISLAAGALLCFILNFRKNHPKKKDLDGKPAGLLIDLNVAIVMLPMGVIGSAIGAIIP